jgi:hypothetical protein
MKRFLVLMLCIMLLMVTPVVAYAAEEGAEVEKSMTEEVVDYVKGHIEELSVIGTLLLTIFYEVRKHGKLNGSIGTLNNNAITVAQNSAETIKTALAGVEGIAEVVNKYKDEIEALLGEIRKSAEEKKALEETLSHVEGLLKTSKLATLELANEVAELLVLANIPVSKKEELYSRHRAAVTAISVAESEVTAHDGEEA